MTRCYNHIVKLLSRFMFYAKWLNLYDKFAFILDKMNVVNYRIEPDVLTDPEWLKPVYKVIAQILTGQIWRHWLSLEMLVEGIIGILKTLFWGICPKIFVSWWNGKAMLVKFFLGNIVPLTSPLGLFLDADNFKGVGPFWLLFLKGS